MDQAVKPQRASGTHIAKFLGLVSALGAGALYVSERYTIGIDFQEQRCLPEIVYVIDTWTTPSAAEIEKGAYIAVRLGPGQLPDYVTDPDQVWVKRMVANEPGTVMQVREDGIFFEADGTRWRHGTALEGAERLDTPAAAFIRDETLGAGQMFLMGDLTMSYDARYFGAVHESNIVGTVLWAF